MAEEKFAVYSTLLETRVFTGTKKQCEDYRDTNERYYGSLYIVKA